MTASEKRKEKRQKENRQVMRTFALVLQLGITMLTCIFLCLYIGRFLADRLGIPALFPIMLVLGILAGFRAVWKLLRQYTRKGPDLEENE